MDDELLKLLADIDKKAPSAADRHKQRISFAFGNAVEDARLVTWGSLKDADRMMRRSEVSGRRKS